MSARDEIAGLRADIARLTSPQPLSYDVPGASAATGHSADTIRRAIAAQDLTVHYVKVNNRTVEKPVILAADLLAWVVAGRTERAS